MASRLQGRESTRLGFGTKMGIRLILASIFLGIASAIPYRKSVPLDDPGLKSDTTVAEQITLMIFFDHRHRGHVC